MTTLRLEKKLQKRDDGRLAKATRRAKSTMYATSVYNRLPRRTEPVAIIEASKEPVMKIPRRRTLAAVATKLYLYDKAGYELLKDRRSDPAILVTSLLDSPFKVILAKHRGYDQQLLLTMTIEFVRQEGKRTQYVAQPKKATEEREPKKPLTRRQQAAALKAPTTPAASATSAFTPPKGAPRTVPRRSIRQDREKTQNALDAVLQKYARLKEQFIDAGRAGQLKQLVRNNCTIKRLATKLKKSQLDEPSRILTYLDKAAQALFTQYEDERLLAEERERMKSEERRRKR